MSAASACCSSRTICTSSWRAATASSVSTVTSAARASPRRWPSTQPTHASSDRRRRARSRSIATTTTTVTILPASRIRRARPRLPSADRPQGTSVLEPFLVRAIVAGLALAVVAAPLGCFVVWQRMAYFGETVAQAGLIGVALSLAFRLDITLGVVVIAVARRRSSCSGSAASRSSRSIPSSGSCTTPPWRPASSPCRMLKGPPVDLTRLPLRRRIRGDQRPTSPGSPAVAAAVLAIVAWLWQPLLRLALHEDLAAAEGIDRRQVRAIFIDPARRDHRGRYEDRRRPPRDGLPGGPGRRGAAAFRHARADGACSLP